MLNIQTLRQEKDRVLAGLKKKNFGAPQLVTEILDLDEKRRAVQQRNDDVAAQINTASKKIGQLMAQKEAAAAEQAKQEVSVLKEQVKALQAQLAQLETEQQDKLVQLPNLPHDSVPAGKSPADNEIVRMGGEPVAAAGEGLPHWDLAVKYGLIDFELGVKITGSGFPVYIGAGAKLQRALISYFLDFNTGAGYKEYAPPYMVNEVSAFATGQLPDKEGQMYYMPEDNYYLIPTAEVPVTNVYRDTIVPVDELPVKMTAYSPCFRREAGSYGKDVRGLNRVHQFDKVEIVQITKPEDSYEALDAMVLHVEQLLQQLGLHYRILRLCGGDMSFASALTYDFEVYSTAQDKWLEVSSVSNFETFQSNRLKLRFKDAQGKTQLLHTLNGSSLALPRIVACILEQYQDEEGIAIPKVLQNYFMGERLV